MIVDEPGPFAPQAEWKAFRAEMQKIVSEQNDPRGIAAAHVKVADAVLSGDRDGERVSRMEAIMKGAGIPPVR